MMADPAYIIEEETKGKGKDEVLRLIRKWEAAKAFWMTVEKHPEIYPQYHSIDPGPDISAWFYGQGLPLLKEKYAALGGDYKADKAKSDAYLFDKRLGRFTGLRLTKRAENVIGAYVFDLKADGEGIICFRKSRCTDPDDELPTASLAYERKNAYPDSFDAFLLLFGEKQPFDESPF